jgi:hypothetical protein
MRNLRQGPRRTSHLFATVGPAVALPLLCLPALCFPALGLALLAPTAALAQAANPGAAATPPSAPATTGARASFSEAETKAAGEGDAGQTIPVEFYKPEAAKGTGKAARVNFSGRTRPGATVSVAGDRIPLIGEGGKVRYMRPKKKFSTRADEDGFFKMQLELPAALIQLPIEIRTAEGQTQVFQLNLMIKKEDVQMQTKQDLIRSPLFKEKYGVWLGAGYNFLIYDQQIGAIPSNFSYSSFEGPALYARFNYRPHDRWLTYLEYKDSPGFVKSTSEALSIAGGNYHWQIFSLEANYTPGPWRRFEYDPWGLISRLSTKKHWGEGAIRFGYQRHIVPVLNRINFDPQISTMEKNSLDVLAVGAQLTLLSAGQWAYELFMKYQLPFNSGGTFDVQPIYGIDGSVGAFYRAKSRWRYGLFWYGQLQRYKFKGLNDAGQGAVDGQQFLFFSNAEFRLGYEW